MLTPGYLDPCQLVWQVNQLGSQEEAPQHLRLVCASHGLTWRLYLPEQTGKLPNGIEGQRKSD